MMVSVANMIASHHRYLLPKSAYMYYVKHRGSRATNFGECVDAVTAVHAVYIL